MGRIKGITVTLTGKTKTGRDDFGHPIYENKEIQVDNGFLYARHPQRRSERVERP